LGCPAKIQADEQAWSGIAQRQLGTVQLCDGGDRVQPQSAARRAARCIQAHEALQDMLVYFWPKLSFVRDQPARRDASRSVPEKPAPSVNLVAEVLNQGAVHYTLGMRGYYLAVPLALLLLGAIWLYLGAVAFTLVLQRIDSAAGWDFRGRALAH
jgi:hypothetical protein